MPSERTPLLGSLPAMLGMSRGHPRAHFLDNLRAILVAILVFQHSATNIINRELKPTPASLEKLLLFNDVNIHVLWVTFYLVSGWAARLGLEARGDLQFLRKRVVEAITPAILYLTIGRWFITRLLQDFDVDIFVSRNPDWTPYAQLSGPGPYVLFLAILEFLYLGTRLFARKFPRFSIDRIYTACPGSTGLKFAITVLVAYAFITTITFLNVQLLTFIPPFFYLLHPGDMPGYGAPFTLVVAYLAGVNSHLVKKHLLIKRPWVAWAGLCITVLFAYYPSPILDFVAGAYKDAPAHIINAITCAIYYPFVGFTLPISLFSVVFSTPYTRRHWNGLAYYAAPVAYIHLVPVAHNIYVVDKYNLIVDPNLKAVTVGTCALGESCLLVLLAVKIWPIIRSN